MSEFLNTIVWPLIWLVLPMLALIVSLLVMLAFLLLFDRKVWAAVALRRGPNVVGPYGLLQSFADFFKLTPLTLAQWGQVLLVVVPACVVGWLSDRLFWPSRANA